ncbi:unnamed protein product, partial [Mycena citricolor]
MRLFIQSGKDHLVDVAVRCRAVLRSKIGIWVVQEVVEISLRARIPAVVAVLFMKPLRHFFDATRWGTVNERRRIVASIHRWTQIKIG